MSDAVKWISSGPPGGGIRLLLHGVLVLVGAASLGAAEFGKDETAFTIDAKRTFLLGISYYGALGAPEEFVTKDLDDMQRDGFNWIRVWATWAAFENNISALETNGTPREPFFGRLEKLISDCDRRGVMVDVTLSREKASSPGPHLQGMEEHERAVRTLVDRLRPYRNWYLDLGNERNIRDARFVSFDDLRHLREFARALDPKRLVTASDSSGDQDFADALDKYLRDAKVDFLAPHRPRVPGSPEQTRVATKLYFDKMQALGVIVPIQYQEPFRRGYTKWEPTADDFLHDLRGAIEGGAAGWCFHNGAQAGATDSAPRRSFDLREKRLYDQLDPVERDVAQKVRGQLSARGN